MNEVLAVLQKVQRLLEEEPAFWRGGYAARKLSEAEEQALQRLAEELKLPSSRQQVVRRAICTPRVVQAGLTLSDLLSSAGRTVSADSVLETAGFLAMLLPEGVGLHDWNAAYGRTIEDVQELVALAIKVERTRLEEA